MKQYLKVAAVLIAFATLSGCAGTIEKFQAASSAVKTVTTAAADTTLSRKGVVVYAKTTNFMISGADIYLQQPICNGTIVVCRNSAATEPLIKAKAAAAKARNDALNFLLTHKGTLGLQGVYDAMTVAGRNLKAVLDAFGVKYTVG